MYNIYKNRKESNINIAKNIPTLNIIIKNLFLFYSHLKISNLIR